MAGTFATARSVPTIAQRHHGTWFNESRRIESVKAHAALGGRLVHGCQSVPNQSGGACVPYLWKRDHVAAHAKGRPLAWIDDDFARADHDWANARTAAGCPTLLIQPDHYTGIQVEHTEAVRRWALTLELPRSA